LENQLQALKVQLQHFLEQQEIAKKTNQADRTKSLRGYFEMRVFI